MNLREAAQRALEAMETEPGSFADWLRTMRAACTALRAALAEDVPETNFGNMAQEVDCYGDGNVYRGQRSRDSKTPTLTINGMPAVEGPLSKAHRTCQESRQVEPVATINKMETVDPVAWIGRLEGGFEYGPYHKAALMLPHGMRFDLYTSPVVAATERERIAAWVEDMCAGLDAKTIANGIRNNGNDDIRAFEVKK